MAQVIKGVDVYGAALRFSPDLYIYRYKREFSGLGPPHQINSPVLLIGAHPEFLPYLPTTILEPS